MKKINACLGLALTALLAQFSLNAAAAEFVEQSETMTSVPTTPVDTSTLPVGNVTYANAPFNSSPGQTKEVIGWQRMGSGPLRPIFANSSLLAVEYGIDPGTCQTGGFVKHTYKESELSVGHADRAGMRIERERIVKSESAESVKTSAR